MFICLWNLAEEHTMVIISIYILRLLGHSLLDIIYSFHDLDLKVLYSVTD